MSNQLILALTLTHLLCFLIQCAFIIKGYQPYIMAYLSNKSIWDSSYDRMKLFYNGGILTVTTIIALAFKMSELTNISSQIIYAFFTVIIIGLTAASKYTSSNKINAFCQSNTESDIEDNKPLLPNENGVEKVLKKLYRELNRYELIDLDATNQQDFINVLTLPSNEHDSIIQLKMDNPETHYFFKLLKDTLDMEITLSSAERLKKIKNSNGNINAKSIYASSNRNKKYSVGPKKGDLIKTAINSAKNS